MKFNNLVYYIVCVILFIFSNQGFTQIIETHEFGETTTQWYVYSDGKTWEFTSENNMNIESIEVKSVLASTGGTFHIEVKIQDNVVAEWDQYVNETQFTPYYNTKYISYALHEGDNIVFKIYGNSSTTYTGAISGINYLKLTGEEGDAYDILFTPLSDLNDARYGAGYTSDGDNIYSVCGGLGEYPWKSSSVEKYDITYNIWTEFATDLIPRRYSSAEYVESQNKIYIFNGDTYADNSYTDTVEIVDITTGEISYSATNPYPVEYGGSAVWNDKIYLFGGSNGSVNSDRLYEFDPAINTWTRLPDMPEAKQTNGEIIDGVLYVFGGYYGTTSKRIDSYDIANSTWSYIDDMPEGISAHAITKSDNNIWIVGSYDNIQLLAIYNVETNDFIQLSSNMVGRRHAGTCIAQDNLYVFGGNQSSSGLVISSLQYADVSDLSGIFNAVNNELGDYSIVSYNYPNPFNEITSIYFSLNKPCDITIEIYDTHGRKIETLLNKFLIKGQHEVQFNGEHLSCGIYFYKIQTGDHSTVKKMLLLK